LIPTLLVTVYGLPAKFKMVSLLIQPDRAVDAEAGKISRKANTINPKTRFDRVILVFILSEIMKRLIKMCRFGENTGVRGCRLSG
jgi:hypothetical protein